MPDRIRKLIEPFRIENGKKFRLKDIDPGETLGLSLKKRAGDLLEEGIAHLAKLQEKLYAQDRWAVLLIFQAMDAAGKDSAIKHVMSGVNPQGCQVFSFKQPTSEDLDHDYLWRTNKRLPERGRIGIFNRSYYEEVLVVRVHKQILANQRVPEELIDADIWQRRFEDITAMERYLSRNGTVIRKFFLHVSKREQKKRFLERIDDPDKNWKFSIHDAKERENWNAYMDAYQEMIRHTATRHAPWFVVPADNKWFTRLVVAAAVIDALRQVDPKFPTLDAAKRKELLAARQELEDE